jgi:hypothetical protein
LTWESPAPYHPAPRRHAHAEAGRVSRTRAQLRQGGIGLVVYQLPDLGLGGGIQAEPLTAAVRLGCQLTSGAVAAQELLDTGKADAKDVGHRRLRAKPALAGVQDFLSPIHRIASHTREARGIVPYDQGKTALSVGRLVWS